jgi:hypothetical protein
LLIDIPNAEIVLKCIPNTPAGLEINRSDVTVRLRLKAERSYPRQRSAEETLTQPLVEMDERVCAAGL